MSENAFLSVPSRTQKPRRAGISHVLDKATPLPLLETYLDQCGDFVDIIKMGWGLAYIDTTVPQRAALCRRHRISLCTGGTFLEIAARQGRVDEFRVWALSQGVDAVEVSNGLELLSRDEKHELVATLSNDFTVYAETGCKSREVEAIPLAWADEMADDITAGAALVIAEGRESGTVGLYHEDGTIRTDVVDAITSRIDEARIIFEAPQRSQQIWLIQHFGPNVSLGNLDLFELSSVETLRLGLRADTAPSLLSGELTR